MSNTRIEYVLQGLSDKSFLDEIIWIFDTPDFEECLLTSAYADEKAVGLLEKCIKLAGDRLTVYVGINNGATTMASIKSLVLKGVCVIGIDTAAHHTIFHQKAYGAKSADNVRLLFTSANLTGRGLLKNYEGGVAIESNDAAFIGVYDDMVASLEKLRERYPENFIAFKTIDDIEAEKGLIKKHTWHSSGAYSSGRPKMAFYRATKLPAANKSTATSEVGENEYGVLIWRGKASRRDLSIPKPGSNTHLTGAFNLGRGKAGLVHDEGKDFQTYYRNVLFQDADWMSDANTEKEYADAWFHVVIDGKNYGSQLLEITHTKAKKTTKQKNATTSIKWGPLLEHVQNENLLGAYISLYSNPDEIDCNFALRIHRPMS